MQHLNPQGDRWKERADFDQSATEGGIGMTAGGANANTTNLDHDHLPGGSSRRMQLYGGRNIHYSTADNRHDGRTDNHSSADDDSRLRLPPEDALGVADAYFAANSAGDFEALRALFVADPASTGRFGIADDEHLFAWNVAQGTIVSPPECAAVDAAVEETMTVTCQAFNHDVLVQAVDGPPVPIRLTLTITPDGISEENGSFGQPDFNTVGEPFDDWMNENHPDEVDAIGFGNWTTIEEAEQNGTLTAQYAAEWATYLQANSCAYNDGC